MTLVRAEIAIVLSSDEIAPAIGRALHCAEYGVVLTDDVDPACPLRSLSFVEAWHFGTAELAGVAACFCSSVKSVPEVIDRQKLVAATTWSWQGLARALSPVFLIDARSIIGQIDATPVCVGASGRLVALSLRGARVRERCANPSPEPRSAAERRLGGQDRAPGYHQRIESHCGSAAPHG